jgi:hypothetical protein
MHSPSFSFLNADALAELATELVASLDLCRIFVRFRVGDPGTAGGVRTGSESSRSKNPLISLSKLAVFVAKGRRASTSCEGRSQQ